MRLSAAQRRCLIQATIDPLVAFPRGFSRTKHGPFFNMRTVGPLLKSGALRAYHPRRGRRGIQISARAQ